MLGSAGNVMEAKSGKLYFWGHSKVRRKRKFPHIYRFTYVNTYLIYSIHTNSIQGVPGAEGDKQYHQCFPKRIFPHYQVCQISADVGTFALLTADGDVFCWGPKRYGFSTELIKYR